MFGVLRVHAGLDRGRMFTVSENQTLVIGRGDHSGTQLRDPSVGRRHCRVEFRDGRMLLTDCGSAFGTRVNGAAVVRCELQPGDEIRIGDTHLSFQWWDGDEQSTRDDRELPPDPPGRPG